LGVWEDIQHKFEVTNFFYNPNIQPKEEYTKRLDNLKIAARGKSRDIIEPNYDDLEHKNAIKGLEHKFPERCVECYGLRLKQTAETAKKLGFDAFSTTLLVSPYQKHDDLKLIGDQIASIVGVDFYYFDWRPYFRSGQKKAKEQQIYRQKYCGCMWSKIEARKTST